MAKLTDRTELTTPADGDLYVTTDVSDTTDAATGTDKKITWANIKAGLKTYFDTLYAAALGADDNYVTDAQKTIIAATTASYTTAEASKLAGIEAGADVTDTTNVTAAGALMDSELVSIADVKALNQSVVSGASPTFGTANMTDASNKRFMTDAQETKLDSVESGADVTDTTNVTAAGALMDSEVTDLVFVKALSDGTASDINTGTDANKVVTADALAGSNLGTRYYVITLNGSTALTTSDVAYFRVPAALTGMNLVSVAAAVGTGASGSSSSGTPTFTVKNVTDNNQMLSTSLTVDASEYTSATAATAAVINTSFDDVVTDDLIEVACTTSGTGVTHATITLGFRLP